MGVCSPPRPRPTRRLPWRRGTGRAGEHAEQALKRSTAAAPSTPHAGVAAAQGGVALLPSADLATLLDSMPPMPAGWKPGDPIPGMASGAGAAERMEEAMALPMEEGAPGEEGERDVSAAPAPAPRPLLKAFDFVLNADFDMDQVEFGGSSDESGDSSQDDSGDGEG